MRLVFRPEARLEVLEAQAWYEQRAPGLGFEFARAVDVAVQAAARRPETHRQVVCGYHHRRDPQAWKERLGD